MMFIWSMSKQQRISVEKLKLFKETSKTENSRTEIYNA